MSPLTPPLPQTQTVVQTPPPPPPTAFKRPDSPCTPPLPPPVVPEQDVIMGEENEFAVQEEVVNESAQQQRDSMSPVSDTELADISPPHHSPETPSESELPSPPPLPTYVPGGARFGGPGTPPIPPPPPPPPTVNLRPPSPIGSPIGSSPDGLESIPSAGRQSAPPPVSGPSDISDTDLPGSGNSENESGKELEELEKAREALRAKLANANLEESSEGEIRTDSDDAESRTAMESKSPAEALKSIETSPVSDSLSPLAISKTTTSDDHKSSSDSDEDKTQDQVEKIQEKKDDDKDEDQDGKESSQGPSGGGAADGGSEPKRDSPPKDQDDKKNEGKTENGGKSHSHGSSSSKKDRKSSRDDDRKHRKSSSHKHHRHEKSSSSKSRRSSHGSERRSSTSSEKNKSKSKEKEGSSKKPSEKEKIRMEKEKLEKIELKIREKSHLKSEKFKDFDMFAPKPPKPKHGIPVRPGSSASSSGGSISPMAFASKSPLAWGVKTPPAFGSKTPPAFGTKSFTPTAKTKVSETTVDVTTVASTAQDNHQTIKERRQSKEKREEPFIVQDRHVERKKFPELPVPKVEGDKLKQHEDDFIQTKRRLAEMKNKKIQEMKRVELEKKMQKALASGQRTPKPKEKKVRPVRPTQKESKPSPAPQPSSTSLKKKLTMSDLSDEDEVSDWSDIESPNIKRKKRKSVLNDSSSEDEINDAEKIQTRKISKKVEAEEILNSDPAIAKLEYFSASDIEKVLELKETFASYLKDEDNISVSSLEAEVLTEPNDFIYLDNLECPRKTKEILSAFGGHPTLVQPIPDWLEIRLKSWGIRRHEVTLYYPDSGFKPRRSISEKTFTERMNKRKGVSESWLIDVDKSQQPPSKKVKSNSESSNVAFVADSIRLPEEEVEPENKEVDVIEESTAKEINPTPPENVQASEVSNEQSQLPENKELSAEEQEEDFHGFHPGDAAEVQMMMIDREDLTQCEGLAMDGFTFDMEDVLVHESLRMIFEEEEKSCPWKNQLAVIFSEGFFDEMPEKNSSEEIDDTSNGRDVEG